MLWVLASVSGGDDRGAVKLLIALRLHSFRYIFFFFATIKLNV